MEEVVCICGGKDSRLVYKGKIRDGKVGKLTKVDHEIVKCLSCGLVRLNNNPLSPDYYQTKQYRESYNSTADPSEYIKEHDSEQAERINKLGSGFFRNSIILDYGCGGGVFLDLVKGLSLTTIGIEPYIGYHDSLRDRGHVIYSDVDLAMHEYKGKVDRMVSFFVIEHVNDPVQYLTDSYNLLNVGGSLYLETDNLNTILFELGASKYEEFFFRTAHQWYFDSDTLQELAQSVGFSEIKISFRHRYDLSNAVLWMRDSIPSGNGKVKILDERINTSWMSFVESIGMADIVCVEMVK